MTSSRSSSIPSRARRLEPRGAFTLVELLVVVAVIAVLMSILLPSLAASRRQSRRTACGANLHSIGQALHLFANQNDRVLPVRPNGGMLATNWWHPAAQPHIKPFEPNDLGFLVDSCGANLKLFLCPGSSTQPTQTAPNQTYNGAQGSGLKVPFNYIYYGMTTGQPQPPWAPRRIGDTYTGDFTSGLTVDRPAGNIGGKGWAHETVNFRSDDLANLPLLSDLTYRYVTVATGADFEVFSNHGDGGGLADLSTYCNTLYTDGSVVLRRVNMRDTAEKEYIFYDLPMPKTALYYFH